MTEVMERKTTTTRALYDVVSDYIDCNRHSRNVNERWLCISLTPLLGVIDSVMNRSKLSEETRKLVAEFRAAEIQKEIAVKRREIEVLERDLKTTAL